tara:strand:- start:302 stop:577 length:276 start_codon:yes stop_codon:yes gene_type:complete
LFFAHREEIVFDIFFDLQAAQLFFFMKQFQQGHKKDERIFSAVKAQHWHLFIYKYIRTNLHLQQMTSSGIMNTYAYVYISSLSLSLSLSLR